MSISKEDAQAYWKENIKIIFSYLAVWFVVSYGCGILFIEELNSIDFFGFQLGFWLTLPLSARLSRCISASRSGLALDQPKSSMLLAAVFIRLLTAWQRQLTGCQRHHSSPWPVSSPLSVVTVQPT